MIKLILTPNHHSQFNQLSFISLLLSYSMTFFECIQILSSCSLDFFPDDIELTINSVIVKIDTTSLYNVKATNTVVARNDSGTTNIVVEAGYYDQESLEELFGSFVTFTEDGYAHPSGGAYDSVFWETPDLRRILRFDEIQAIGVKGRVPVDISNGLNCIRIYSNLVKQIISF